jgi:hypothetical protein
MCKIAYALFGLGVECPIVRLNESVLCFHVDVVLCRNFANSNDIPNTSIMNLANLDT